MKIRTLSIVAATLLAMSTPSFALADRGDRSGGRYHSAGNGRGDRYERGQPYRRSSYHGRDYDRGHDRDWDHGHRSRSSLSFSFGFGSYYPVYREPVSTRSYYYEPAYCAPVYVAPPVTYYAPRPSYDESCYSSPSTYYYGEARYYYGR